MPRNAPEPNAKLADKKAAVLGTSSRGRKPLLAAAAAAVLLAAAAAGYFAFGPTSSLPVATGVAATGDLVAIPVATFDDGKAHYFEHRHGDLTIRYFAIKSADGVIRAAFDACDVCWRAGKGYAQDGAYLICRNCGMRFHSTQVNDVKGGCNPAPLERRVENGKLLIRVNDIAAGKGYFDFGRKG
ncbi:MAG: DUF2318 domain-containing protein [Desulfobacterales bacterium]|jgi:uncharacterized membrane protein|nr:DUF2318 domain-containing protein [Desulfobacterales bacterium]